VDASRVMRPTSDSLQPTMFACSPISVIVSESISSPAVTPGLLYRIVGMGEAVAT
jgi:hypothetical protein